MITNLPLLFVRGSPISLENMTIQELECFIPFLVHCSWGHDTAKTIQQPNWWPSNVPFSDPLIRPKIPPKEWAVRLRELIRLCYKHHCSEFLLKFCEELASNSPSALQYVNNCDSTTSLYLKSTHRLLVTFRNENMLYDRKAGNRKCLLPQRQTSGSSIVESEAVEIFLCDTCDEVFHKLEDYQNHEKLCTQQNVPMPFPPSPEALSPEPDLMESDDQQGFLRMLGLRSSALETSAPSPVKHEDTSETRCSETRERRAVIFNGLTNYPFSSPAGMRSNKARLRTTEASIRQREHLDRYCSTPSSSLEGIRWFSKACNRHFPVRFKKPEDYWPRVHTFPGQRDKIVLDLKSQLLFLECKPSKVVMDCLTPEQINDYTNKPNCWTKLYEKNMSSSVNNVTYDNDIEFISVTTYPESFRSEIITKRRLSGKKTSSVKKNSDENKCTQNPIEDNLQQFVEIDIPLDVIDLCSDDDDQNENVHPSPTAYHSASDITPQSLVLATTPEFLQPLNTNTEFEGAQYHTNLSSSQVAKTQLVNIREQGHSRLKPLQQCHDNLFSSHVNNVISLD